jgi:hypothetical protein
MLSSYWTRPINQHPQTQKIVWQYYFGLVLPPINKHPSGKFLFMGGEKLIWFWCVSPDGSGAGLKGMQNTNSSGKEMYCAESMEEMLYSYVNTYIYTHIY